MTEGRKDSDIREKAISGKKDPSVAVVEFVPLFEAHKQIYAKSTKGRFTTWRWILVWATQLLYYGLPWLDWGSRQAVLFDMDARRFYLFGVVLYPQDFIFLAALLIASALLLFVVTAVAGRLWCGYACPQTVYSSIFMWIERKVEGDRAQRMRLDASSVNRAKVWRKALKHFLWIVLALWTGFTFVGYFIPIKQLAHDVVGGNIHGWSMFWMLFYSFATYGAAGFLREQVCKYMCPYARFQSAMFDKDTMIVSYDTARGEPRGGRKKDAVRTTLGDCVDCSLCVQVCPTGIDIRKGLQYECISCGVCVDACDGVMDKMAYPRGLIRYTTQNALANKWSFAQTMQRLRRPRILVYATILTFVAGAILFGLTIRTPFKVDVVRDRAVLARIATGGQLENVYRLNLMNATERPITVKLAASGLPNLTLSQTAPITIEPAKAEWIVLSAFTDPGATQPGSHRIDFHVESSDGKIKFDEKSVFIVPR